MQRPHGHCCEFSFNEDEWTHRYRPECGHEDHHWAIPVEVGSTTRYRYQEMQNCRRTECHTGVVYCRSFCSQFATDFAWRQSEANYHAGEDRKGTDTPKETMPVFIDKGAVQVNHSPVSGLCNACPENGIPARNGLITFSSPTQEPRIPWYLIRISTDPKEDLVIHTFHDPQALPRLRRSSWLEL